jgi:hypothetical protein
MEPSSERLQILELIEKGKISASEGLRLLEALGPGEQPEVERGEVLDPPPGGPPSPQPAFKKWDNFWQIPFWTGVGIMALSGWVVFSGIGAASFGFGFFCASLWFLLGLGIMALGWQTRTARWLHLRVHQPPGEKPQRIAISFPLPMGLLTWILRTFKGRIPSPNGIDIEKMLWAVQTSTSPENPLTVQVDEGERGERVEIYIG